VGCPASGERVCAGGRHSLPSALPAPPRSNSGPGTLTPPLTVRGRPGTTAGCGPAASCRAVRSPRTGGPSGGGRSGTACSPIMSVMPPRGARPWHGTKPYARRVGGGGCPGLRPWGPWLRRRVTRGPHRGDFHGARPGGHALLGVRGRCLHGWARVRLHRFLRGASRGCPGRRVRLGRLVWRGEGRCAHSRTLAAQARTGSADRGDHTRIRQPTAGCSPGRAPVSGAPPAGPTATWPEVGVAGGRPGRGRKRPATEGGPTRKSGAWPPTWGQTAARPVSFRTSPACCPRAGCLRACVPS